MQQKNTPISILRKSYGLPSLLYKGRFIVAVIFSVLLLLTSCSKVESSLANPVLQQYFVTNFLNRNFIVEFASDSNVNITSLYATDTFVLRQDATSLLNGPITATSGTSIYTGTWSSNSDYSQLNINISNPSPIPGSFIFVNRSWKFTSKSLPVMELAPWGSTDPKILYMQQL